MARGPAAVELAGSVEEDGLNVRVGWELDAAGNPVLDASGQPIPVFATFQCARPAAESAAVCIELGPPKPTGFEDGDFCTYTQGKYNDKAQNPVATYLSAEFSNLAFRTPGEKGNLVIGTRGSDPLFHASWTDVSKFRVWIGGGGKSGPLSADTTNATSTDGGTLAMQTATLTVSLALSGVMPDDPQGLGGLFYCNAGDALSGKTIGEILDAANAALGTGAKPYVLPTGYTFSSLNDLLDDINSNAFHDCRVGDFAVRHLSRTACP